MKDKITIFEPHPNKADVKYTTAMPSFRVKVYTTIPTSDKAYTARVVSLKMANKVLYYFKK
jgi:hypothetical protein